MNKGLKKIIKASCIFIVFAVLTVTLFIFASADELTYANEATLTVKKGGFNVESKKGSFDELMTYINELSAQSAANATYTVTLNSDATVENYYELSNFPPTAKLVIDLDGYTVLAEKAGTVIQMRSSYDLEIDGADKNGKRGKWITTASVPTVVYIRAEGDNYTTDNAVARISNLDIVATNMSSAGHSVINMLNGTCYLDGVNISYTGEDFSASAAVEQECFIKASKGNLFVNNCELLDLNERGITTCGILSSAAKLGSVKVENTKIEASVGISSNSYRADISDCDIFAESYVLFDRGRFIVTDSVLKTEGGSLFHYESDVKLSFGTGKTEVSINPEATLQDQIVFDSGYALKPFGNGVFRIAEHDGYASLSLPRIFADGMVFQRGEPINVFGYSANEGVTVEVTLDGKTECAIVSDGEWRVSFEPMEAMRGLTLSVTEKCAAPVTYTYSDVCVGEVWVISGQSNAEFQFYKMEDADEYVARADNYADRIRIFRQPAKSSFSEERYGFGGWHILDAANLLRGGSARADVPAIGYVAATHIASALGNDVPVAIIDATYGGSGIYTWIDHDRIVNNFGGTSSMDRLLETYDAYVEYIEENDREPLSADELYCYVEKVYSSIPAVNYNTMIAPLKGYTAKGVIWYQGEANLGLKDRYIDAFSVLSESYKEAFANESLSFFAVQLAPYGTTNTSDFRASQYKLSELDNTYVISAATEGAMFSYDEFTYDSTGKTFIHPSRKSPIGLRCALSILKNVYGLYGGEVVEAPIIRKIEANGEEVVITFDTELAILYGNVPLGFEIAGSDGVFALASAEIEGKTLRLRSNSVEEPTKVRYGFGRMMIELEDGSTVEFVSNTWDEMKAAIVVDAFGNSHRIEADSDVVIRSRYPGNLTNASGIPMLTFSLDVGYVNEN